MGFLYTIKLNAVGSIAFRKILHPNPTQKKRYIIFSEYKSRCFQVQLKNKTFSDLTYENG